MNLKSMEASLNRRLKAIRSGYAVRHLRLLPNGEFWFELAVAFNPRDLAKVNRVFAEVMSKRPVKRKPVQAKFYLTPETYDRLRRRAAARGVAQSALVEEALLTALG